MKKLLSGLLLAPLALAACGDAAGEDKTAVAYGYTHGGYITKATVTAGSDFKIKSVEIDETYAKMDSTKTEWSEATEVVSKAAFNKDFTALKVMGHKDKGLCLAAIELQDTSGTANAAGDYPGVGVYRPMIGMDGDAATHTIGTGSTAVTIDIKINKANCEATTAGTGIDLPLGGKWLEAGSTAQYWMPIKMNDANSAVTNLDKAYDMAKTYKAVLGSSTGKPGWNVTMSDAELAAADHFKLEKGSSDNMMNSKMWSQGKEGIQYGKGRFDWKKSMDAITTFFKDKQADTEWSKKYGKEGTTVDGQTEITGATASDTYDYVKTIQAAMKKIVNGTV